MMALAQPLYYCDLLLFKSVFLYCLSWHQCSKKVFLHITVNLIRCGSASKFVLAGTRQLATRIKRQPNLPLQPAMVHGGLDFLHRAPGVLLCGQRDWRRYQTPSYSPQCLWPLNLPTNPRPAVTDETDGQVLRRTRHPRERASATGPVLHRAALQLQHASAATRGDAWSVPLWRSFAKSPETVSTGRHWKTCCGIAWSVAAETTAYNASSWPSPLSQSKRLWWSPNQTILPNRVPGISWAAQCINSVTTGGTARNRQSLANVLPNPRHSPALIVVHRIHHPPASSRPSFATTAGRSVSLHPSAARRPVTRGLQLAVGENPGITSSRRCMRTSPWTWRAVSYYSPTTRSPSPPIKVSVTLSKAETTMEVDTGANLSIMSEKTYDRLWTPDARPPLRPSSARLSTYTGEKISVLGVITVHAAYQHQQHQLHLLIVPGSGPSSVAYPGFKESEIFWLETTPINYDVITVFSWGSNHKK